MTANRQLLERLDEIARDAGYEIALADDDEQAGLVRRFLDKLAASIAASRTHRSAA